MSLSRRDILRQIPILAATPLLASPVVSGGPKLSFPKAPKDRLSVTSWPFRDYMAFPGNRSTAHTDARIDMKDFPGMIAKRFQVHNINPLLNHFASTEPAYLDAFRAAVHKAGSHVVDLGLASGFFYDTDSAKRDAAIALGRKGIDAAVAIGSPSVRQHITGAAGAPANVALASESLAKLAEYGSSKNVVVNLENDHAVSEDPFFIVSILEKVKNPYLRALPDFGNSLQGHDAEFNRKAITAMLPHAFNMCHVKNSVQSENGAVYTVDLQTTFRLAKAASFPGYFSMEFDTAAGDPFPGTERLIAETLKYLK